MRTPGHARRVPILNRAEQAVPATRALARRGGAIVLGLVLTFSGAIGRTLAQCAMCGTALQGRDDPLWSAIGWSVALLMLMPVTLFSSIGLWLYLAHRRARAAQEPAPLLPFRSGDRGFRSETVKEGIR